MLSRLRREDDKNVKRKHWRASQTINAPNTAPINDFAV